MEKNQGLSTGNISRMAIDFQNQGETLNNLTIRMKQTILSPESKESSGRNCAPLCQIFDKVMRVFDKKRPISGGSSSTTQTKLSKFDRELMNDFFWVLPNFTY